MCLDRTWGKHRSLLALCYGQKCDSKVIGEWEVSNNKKRTMEPLRKRKSVSGQHFLAISCTFRTCELENNLYNKNQPNSDSGEEIFGKYPCHLVPPLDRTLAVFADKKTRTLRTTRCNGNVSGWTCKRKRTTTTVESIGKITKEKRNWIQSDPCSEKNIKKIRCLFFSRKPTGSPTFPSCWGSLFDIFVAGPLLGTKNRWTKLFRGHGKKPTSIDVSSTPMRFKSCQPVFQDVFFAFSRSFFCLLFTGC